MFRLGTQRQVFEAMTYDVVWVSPEATLAAAARTIRRFDAGPLPVCANNRLLGVVTDRDLTSRAATEGRAPAQTTVAEVMNTEIVSCRETDAIEDVTKRMLELQVRRLLVVNSYGKLVGTVSLGDLIGRTGDASGPGRGIQA